MPFCRNCGSEISDATVYCPHCGTQVVAQMPTAPIRSSRFELTGWGERFFAWIIDIIIIGVLLSPIKIFLWVAWPSFVWAPNFLRWIPFVDFGLDNVVYFLYWTYMEGVYGQSIGKMVMKIQVVQLDGRPTDLGRAAIESLGKAFLLPIDCIIGWLRNPTKRQRLFNYISDTIVVRKS